MSSSQVKVEELVRIPAFKSLTGAQVERLAGVMTRQVYAPGQLIFLEGEAAGGLWFVAEGRVKIIKQSLNGRVLALCMVSRGKCFGTCPLFNGEVNPATAQALDQVTLLILPREALAHYFEHDPQLGSALLRVYSQRLAHLARLSEELGTWTAADRINDCLISYADYREAQPTVALTHEKLAALAGTVREVVTRHLAQLEKSGYIRVEPGQITLLDIDGLSYHCLCPQATP